MTDEQRYWDRRLQRFMRQFAAVNYDPQHIMDVIHNEVHNTFEGLALGDPLTALRYFTIDCDHWHKLAAAALEQIDKVQDKGE